MIFLLVHIGKLVSTLGCEPSSRISHLLHIDMVSFFLVLETISIKLATIFRLTYYSIFSPSLYPSVSSPWGHPPSLTPHPPPFGGTKVSPFLCFTEEAGAFSLFLFGVRTVCPQSLPRYTARGLILPPAPAFYLNMQRDGFIPRPHHLDCRFLSPCRETVSPPQLLAYQGRHPPFKFNPSPSL